MTQTLSSEIRSRHSSLTQKLVSLRLVVDERRFCLQNFVTNERRPSTSFMRTPRHVVLLYEHIRRGTEELRQLYSTAVQHESRDGLFDSLTEVAQLTALMDDLQRELDNIRIQLNLKDERAADIHNDLRITKDLISEYEDIGTLNSNKSRMNFDSAIEFGISQSLSIDPSRPTMSMSSQDYDSTMSMSSQDYDSTPSKKISKGILYPPLMMSRTNMVATSEIRQKHESKLNPVLRRTFKQNINRNLNLPNGNHKQSVYEASFPQLNLNRETHVGFQNWNRHSNTSIKCVEDAHYVSSWRKRSDCSQAAAMKRPIWY